MLTDKIKVMSDKNDRAVDRVLERVVSDQTTELAKEQNRSRLLRRENRYLKERLGDYMKLIEYTDFIEKELSVYQNKEYQEQCAEEYKSDLRKQSLYE